MSRVDGHREMLRSLPPERWEAHLTEHSGLPGPRADLELLRAFVEEAPPGLVRRCAASADEYLAACGAAALGRLLASGDRHAAQQLHDLATDARWRVREGVAMGLQRLGDADGVALRGLVAQWASHPSRLVQRAAIAGICEPRLLVDERTARTALDALDRITGALVEPSTADRRGDEAFRVLRQALGSCWSVAVAALPGDGLERFERWVGHPDRDVRWVVRTNLRKQRLQRADPTRVERLIAEATGPRRSDG